MRQAAQNQRPSGCSNNGHCKNGQTGGAECSVVPLAVAEKSMIERALDATSWNQTQAAELLGVERHRLGRLIRRHALQRPTNGGASVAPRDFVPQSA